jgi:hypothetical protein
MVTAERASNPTYLIKTISNFAYHGLGWVSIARGCRAQLFVRGKLVRFFTVFVSGCRVWLLMDAVPQTQDRLN